MLHTVEWC